MSRTTSGTQCGNDPYLAQFDKVEEKGYPWNFELPGKGSFKIDHGNGCRPQGGLRQAGGAWLAQLDVVPTSSQHVHPQDGRVLRQLRIERRGLHQHHPGRPHQSGIPHQHGLLPPTPAACPSTAATSTKIGRPNASSSWMTRPGTTCRAPGTGRPWAPASPKRRRTGSWPCSTCPRRWGRRRPSRSSPPAPPA